MNTSSTTHGGQTNTSEKDPETTYAAEYLLEPGYHHLHDCRTNETALIRKLMEVQK